MKRLLRIIILLIVGIFSLTTCNRESQKAEDEKVVALVVKTLNNPFFIDLERGAEETAAKLGVKLLVQAAEREMDVDQQMQIIENLIQRKVDVLCIAPSGSKEIIPAILKLNAVNIPVIAVDSKVDSAALLEAGGFVTSYIGSDNFRGGYIAGEFIIKVLGGKGKIAVLEGLPGHETGDQRLAGFHAAVSKNNKIEIVSSQTANWERDKGYNVFQNMLQAHPEIQAVFACNDIMALGAVEAVSVVARTGDIIVVGFDAIDDTRQAILDGSMNASIAQHPYDMGKIAVETALKIINGEDVSSNIPVKIELITKEKLSQ